MEFRRKKNHRYIFQIHLETGKLPSLKQCQEAIMACPELKYRTAPQVKVWISNQLKNNKNYNQGSGSNIKRTHWTQSEVSIAMKCFGKHLHDQLLPSAEMCKKLTPMKNSRTELPFSSNFGSVTKSKKEKKWI